MSFWTDKHIVPIRMWGWAWALVAALLIVDAFAIADWLGLF